MANIKFAFIARNSDTVFATGSILMFLVEEWITGLLLCGLSVLCLYIKQKK